MNITISQRFTSMCSKECSYSLYLEGFDLLFLYHEVWRDDSYYWSEIYFYMFQGV